MDLKQLEQALKAGADANHSVVLQFMHSYPSRVNPKAVCLLVKYGLDVNHIYKADSNETALFWWLEQLNFGRGRSPAWWQYRSSDEPIIFEAVKCLLCQQTDWNIIWQDGWYKKHTVFDVLEKSYNRDISNNQNSEQSKHALDQLLDHIMAIESVLDGLKTKSKISLLRLLLQRKHPAVKQLIEILRDTEIHLYRKHILKTFLRNNLYWLKENSPERELFKTVLSHYSTVEKIQRVLKENYSGYDESRWQTLLELQLIGLSNQEFETHIQEEMARCPENFQILMNKIYSGDHQQGWLSLFKAQYGIDLSEQRDKDGLTEVEKTEADRYVKEHDYWDFLPVLEENYNQKLDGVRNISEFYELQTLLADEITDYQRYIIREFYFTKGTSTSTLLSSAWSNKSYSSGALQELERYDLRYLQTGLQTEGYEHHSMYGEQWYEEWSFKEDLLPQLSEETIQKLRELGHEDI